MIDHTTPRGEREDKVEGILERAVAQANVPVLLALLVQLTGNARWLGPRYRTTRGRGQSDHDTGGLDDEVQREVRAAAVNAIRRWRAGTPMAVPRPDRELLTRIAAAVFGEEPPPEYVEMIADEICGGFAVRPASDRRLVQDALIVGAGISGLCAAVQLGAVGVDCTLLERNPALGGTWYANRYPGCAVDTPSHLYSYSFAPHDWPNYFATREQVRAYLEEVAEKYDLHGRIRFGTQVLGARFDDTAQEWIVDARAASGIVEEYRARILISAVGALSEPKVPAIPGSAEFEGPQFHSACWPDDFTVEGKRIAVIGTGATAMQLVPAIAGSAAKVEVFQRSAQWAAPFEKFRAAIPDDVRALLAEVPLYRLWYRIRLAWTFNDSTYSALVVDPDWPDQERSVSAANDRQRQTLTRYLESEVGDDPDLLAKAMPTYPPFGKRMLLDNRWFRTIARPDVHLETSDITSIVREGVVTADGTIHAVDAIVYATGFDAVNFLSSIEVIGRDDVRLHDRWGLDDARAYLGMMVPGFPNFFCLYGPNVQPGHGGSLIFSVECQVRLLVALLEAAGEDMGTIDCEVAAFDQYNAEVDAMHQRMIWTHPAVQTYYRNSRGRVVVNTPFRVVDYWQRTREIDPGAFRFEPRGEIATGAPPAVRG